MLRPGRTFRGHRPFRLGLRIQSRREDHVESDKFDNDRETAVRRVRVESENQGSPKRDVEAVAR